MIARRVRREAIAVTRDVVTESMMVIALPKQRMHYIIHLFRAYADEASLFSRPFTPDQVARFRAGGIPGGQL